MEFYWTLIIGIFVSTVGVYFLVYRNVNYFKRKGIPYIKAKPLLGNMGPVISGKLCLAENIQNLYNMQSDVKYVGVHDFMNPVVMLRDPELIKSVAIKNFDNFQDHESFVDGKIDLLFGNNLFSLRGDRWRNVRAVLSPAFTSSKMKLMFELISHCGVELSDYLVKSASQPIDMEMKDIFNKYTNDVIATSAFGISVKSFKDQENEFYMMGREATTLTGIQNLKLFIHRFSSVLSRLFQSKVMSDKVDKYFSNVIRSTITMRDKKGIVRNDMIQLMMQARDSDEKIKLSIDDMAAQAFVFFFGGFHTSSTLMSFVAYEVGINPAIQKKLQAEIDAVLAKDQGDVTYESLHGMWYLDAVINEALRLYPPLPMMDRICTKTFELPSAAPTFSPFTVKVGSTIWIPCHGIHRDPKYFPNPEKFDPERFSDENKGNFSHFAYFPFGLGPRICIASRFALMETRLALFHLFAKCNLSPCSKTAIPIKLSGQNFTTVSENGFWLKVQRRS